jgi:hypothetical protein
MQYQTPGSTGHNVDQPVYGGGPIDASGHPLIIKRGTIDLNLVAVNPVVIGGKLYRFEWVVETYWNNPTGRAYSRFVDYNTRETTQPFAWDYAATCAFIDDDDTAYVTGSVLRDDAWTGRVDMFASRDLCHWESWTALDLDGFGILNTSICRADGKYVMMIEIGSPPEQTGVPFTARFATSDDMKHWELTPPECNYALDRYTAPQALRYLDGWYYDFYLERVEAQKEWQQYVVRSRDLIHWELSPFNPVLRPSQDDKAIYNPTLSAKQCELIAGAVNINNSDIDFCEYQGKVIVNYAWGNQGGTEFLAEADYNGTLKQFLEGWFPARP